MLTHSVCQPTKTNGGEEVDAETHVARRVLSASHRTHHDGHVMMSGCNDVRMTVMIRKKDRKEKNDVCCWILWKQSKVTVIIAMSRVLHGVRWQSWLTTWLKYIVAKCSAATASTLSVKSKLTLSKMS